MLVDHSPRAALTVAEAVFILAMIFRLESTLAGVRGRFPSSCLTHRADRGSEVREHPRERACKE